MTSSSFDARALAQTGFEAMHRGDAHKARESFERVVAAGRADAAVHAALAYACRKLDDKSSALAAAEKALALDPRNLRALILKADHYAEIGDGRAAASFYQFALKTAPSSDQLPADLRSDLGKAQDMVARYAGEFESFLRDALSRGGLVDGRSASRFRQSIDILLGKKQIYFQQPHTFFFPELPQIQFYDREAFPWLDRVEAATDDIRAELVEVMKNEAAFKPYVESDPSRPRKEQEGMTENPDWGAFYLWRFGEIVPANAAQCPRTMQVMGDIPLAVVKNRSPSVLFSLLRPGARIPPHTGLVNTRLICHLPLIVPPGCGFRVGNDVRTPVEGKAWVFDDTMEHEAWNGSDRTRVILLFETWRPELRDEERALVSTMFSAIDEYTGQKPEWSI
jgi:aspartyl/asparaginyl beta-hydroxylase (cupin superfamily)